MLTSFLESVKSSDELIVTLFTFYITDFVQIMMSNIGSSQKNVSAFVCLR